MGTAVKHQIKWFVYSAGQKLAREATMRGSWDGYDAECSCGWATHTGGAIKARVAEAVHDHKWEVENGWWHPQGIEFSPAAIAARSAPYPR